LRKNKLQKKAKMFFICIMVFCVLSFATIAPPVKAAGGITVTPNTNVAAGSTVQVQGTGFNATQAVAIATGNEVAGSNVNMAFTGTGMGPYSGTVSKFPIKPGSFVLISDTSSGGGIVSTYTDKGDGTCTWSYDGTTMGTINYTSGAWSRSTTVDVTGYATNYSATYTYYQYNLTPSTGVTTSSTGTFTASVTIPSGLSSGVFNVTAIDGKGNIAAASVGVGVPVPETLSVGAVVVLSSVALVAGAVLLRKPKVKTLNSAKL
jgi:hypothetical protein